MIEVDSARRSFNLGKSHLIYFSIYFKEKFDKLIHNDLILVSF